MIPDRRHEVSRLEAFSDAAFAFALTLLVVSLDVPRSYDELVRTMRGYHLVSASVGFVCVAFALLAPVDMSPLAPTMFALLGPLHWVFGVYVDRRRKSVVAAQR